MTHELAQRTKERSKLLASIPLLVGALALASCGADPTPSSKKSDQAPMSIPTILAQDMCWENGKPAYQEYASDRNDHSRIVYMNKNGDIIEAIDYISGSSAYTRTLATGGECKDGR